MTNDQQGPTPPTPPNQGGKPEQPDLGKAAKDLWAAAKAKAKELGGKAAEAAKDAGAKASEEAKHLQATSQPSKDPTSPAGNLKDKALDVWRRAPTLVVVCGAALLVLCSSCCVCTGLFSLLSGTKGFPGASNQKTPSKAGTTNDSSADQSAKPTIGEFRADEGDAKVVAERFVKERLKAPSTADFPSMNEYRAVETEKNVWRVTGYVDAQNAFGAKLRANWTVKMRYNGPPRQGPDFGAMVQSHWSVISCDIAE